MLSLESWTKQGADWWTGSRCWAAHTAGVMAFIHTSTFTSLRTSCTWIHLFLFLFYFIFFTQLSGNKRRTSHYLVNVASHLGNVNKTKPNSIFFTISYTASRPGLHSLGRSEASVCAGAVRLRSPRPDNQPRPLHSDILCWLPNQTQTVI